MRLQVDDLPKVLGMGRRTLFDCRKDDKNVTDKSWAKLEHAEHRAGMQSATKCETAESSAKVKESDVGESAHVLRDELPIYATRRPPRPLTLDERVAKLEKVLKGIQDALNRL